MQVELDVHAVGPTESANPCESDAAAARQAEIDAGLEEEQPFFHEHFGERSPWLRAFVLGANDGLVVTSSLMLGFAGNSDTAAAIRLAGVASWIAGALSMALGEYVSVSSQRDCEQAELKKEGEALMKAPRWELQQLAEIYTKRGLSEGLARQVAEELTAKDALRAHARDELGIDLDELSNPLQAAVVSAVAFSCGAGIPLLAGAFLLDPVMRIVAVVVAAVVGLLFFGALGAYLGGANMLRGAGRVLLGGASAMGATYGIGVAFNSIH